MGSKGKHFFTSESVATGHPDKLADQISDSVLDAILTNDPMGRVACETLVTTGLVFIAGEITTKCYADIPNIARQTIKEIGYTGYISYEFCHSPLDENMNITGIERVHEQVQYAREYMLDLIQNS